MRKIIFMAIMAVGFATNSMAQNDALVVEWNNGLADIYPVSTDLRIDNKTANDSIILSLNNKVIASYARADIKRITFDTEDILTDSRKPRSPTESFPPCAPPSASYLRLRRRPKGGARRR